MYRRHLLALAAAVLLPLSSAHADPVKLRVNYSVVPPHIIPVLAMKDELFKHKGKSYTTEFIFTRGSAIVLQAMAAREMDLGVLTMPPFVNGIVNAKQPLVAIADLTQDGPWFSAIYAVRENSPVKSVKDLKGKTVASLPAGSGLDGALRAMLLKHGLKPDTDVRIVEAGFGAMEAMLREEKVELSILVAPFWESAKKKGGIRPLFTMKDVVGDNQHLFWSARRDFLDKNEAVLIDFFEDYIRAQRWALKPENRNELLDMVAKYTKRPVSNFQWAFKEGSGYYRMPDLRIDRKVFQNTADALHEVGFLPKFDTSSHIDESIVTKAAERLR